MNIVKVTRSFEACAEAGWFGYDIHLECPVDETSVKALYSLGKMTFMKQLKNPFFVVRADKFLVRGVLGNSFVRAGIAQNDPETLDFVLETLRAAP